MDYTQSDHFVTHPGTGNRMHEDNAAIPTAVTEKDTNSVIWSLMELLKVSSLAGAQFDEAVPATYTKVRDAIDIMIRSLAGASCAAGGTADAITGDFSPDVSSLATPFTVYVRAAFTNGTTTPSFKADGTAIQTIVKGNNLPLAIGDIPGAGFIMELRNDPVIGKYVLQNPATGLNIGVTPAQFDNSTKLATMAAVQRALGSDQALVTVSAPAVLTAGDVGKNYAVTAAVAITIPLASSVGTGSTISLESTIAGASVVRSGADTFVTGASTATSLSLNAGDSVTLKSNGVAWYVAGGSLALAYAAVFAKSLGTSGYQKLPGGLILQWVQDATTRGAGAAVAVTWPLAFASAGYVATVSPRTSGTNCFACLTGMSATGITVDLRNDGSTGFFVIAIGQ